MKSVGFIKGTCADIMIVNANINTPKTIDYQLPKSQIPKTTLKTKNLQAKIKTHLPALFLN